VFLGLNSELESRFHFPHENLYAYRMLHKVFGQRITKIFRPSNSQRLAPFLFQKFCKLQAKILAMRCPKEDLCNTRY
jgi:hypothetical protein